tara:strand:- start:1126 stop:1554 length:429 start_codon:yes stop_codon:yes gene_type:complete
MGRFIGFGNCKNCSKRFRKKSLGSKYCSPGCRSSFNLKQENDKKNHEEFQIMECIKNGANSHEEIATSLGITLTKVARFLPRESYPDTQKWFQELERKKKEAALALDAYEKALSDKSIREEEERLKLLEYNKKNPTLPKGFS